LQKKRKKRNLSPKKRRKKKRSLSMMVSAGRTFLILEWTYMKRNRN